ncbi:MAG: hypothetical protein JRG73_19700 [Deltaproteobacteria bacterium]|nr:hypothetical protein [Deltaproteobacteria bacterium]MBW2309154.1 hypothetical protein [Deltaproteobacteria bacterium]
MDLRGNQGEWSIDSIPLINNGCNWNKKLILYDYDKEKNKQWSPVCRKIYEAPMMRTLCEKVYIRPFYRQIREAVD